MFRLPIQTPAIAANANALAGWPAKAGVEIATATRTPGSDSASPETGRIWIDGPRLRLESGERGNAMIFRADQGVLWTLDPETRTYLHFDRETGKAIGEKVAAARREMEARMAQLPPEQRAMMEKMMSGQMPAALGTQTTEPQRPLKTQDTGKTRNIDGKSCRVFALTRAGETQGDVCLAEWKTAGVKRNELAVFGEMAEFMRENLGQLGGAPAAMLAQQPYEIFGELGGFPLETRKLRNGEVTSQTRFVAIENSSPHRNLFQPPPGYTRRNAGPLGPQPGR
jgi:hypothetical protein